MCSIIPGMRLGYAILYVRDVAAALDFYERAFGLERRFVAEDATYGELETGDTTLSFAAHSMAPVPVEPTRSGPFEIALVTEEVDAAFARAVEAGAEAVLEPTDKPWGQRVAYVRDPDGVLVELCTPVG